MDVIMRNRIDTLFPHELETLLDALRRDMRNELIKAESDPGSEYQHLANAYFVKKILHTLNPKRHCFQSGESMDAV